MYDAIVLALIVYLFGMIFVFAPVFGFLLIQFGWESLQTQKIDKIVDNYLKYGIRIVSISTLIVLISVSIFKWVGFDYLKYL